MSVNHLYPFRFVWKKQAITLISLDFPDFSKEISITIFKLEIQGLYKKNFIRDNPDPVEDDYFDWSQIPF
jgi:hypothetical protein